MRRGRAGSSSIAAAKTMHVFHSGTWRLFVVTLSMTHALATADNSTDNYPVLKNAPVLLKASYHNLSFSIPNLAYTGDGKPPRIQMQVKLSSDEQGIWKEAGERNIIQSAEFTVLHLLAGTEYRVRAVIVNEDGKSNQGDGVPSTLANTTCQAPMIKNTVVGPRSIIVIFQEKSSLNCPWKFYHLQVLSKGMVVLNRGLDSYDYHKLVNIRQLNPYTSYQILVMRDVNVTAKVQVKTEEDAPSAVRKLRYDSRSSSSITVVWSPPDMPNGIIRDYHISYQHTNYRGCAIVQQNLTSKGSMRTTIGAVRLEGLVPYSNYSIEVRARTVEEGVPSMIFAWTSAVDVPVNKPTLENENNLDISSTHIIFNLIMANCSELRSPLVYYRIVLRGTSPWNREYLKKITAHNSPIRLYNLTPDSGYNISVYIEWPSGVYNSHLPLNYSFKTKVGGPPPVRDLTAYSHGPTWISVRWRHPYPSHGILEGYRESHYTGNTSTVTANNDVTNTSTDCALWPDMTCYTIRDQSLIANRSYTVKILAYNRINLTGESSVLIVRTAETASSPPLNLSVSEVTAHNLTFSWVYPSIPSGDLKRFRIHIVPSTSLYDNESILDSVPVKDSVGTYNYTMHNVSFDTDYNVTVWGFSVVDGEAAGLVVRMRVETASSWQSWWQKWWWLFLLLFLPLLCLVAFFVVKWSHNRRKVKKKSFTDQLALNMNEASQGNVYQLDHSLITELKERNISKQTEANSKCSQSRSAKEVELSVPTLSYRVSVHKLEDYVMKSLETGELRRQHSIFPAVPTELCLHGKQPQNLNKNRKENLVAYDATRVVLKKLPDDPSSDYINANYVDGYKSPKFYIATQGPKPNTVADFWRMVWQEHVQVICMLANVVEDGEIASELYWPDLDKEVTYGEVTILTASAQVFPDYVHRRFIITHKHNRRMIQHWHFTSWSARAPPLYPYAVAGFLKKMLTASMEAGPIVVHCRDGVGRTGATILTCINLRMAVSEDAVDVLHVQQLMRKQRPNIVDSELLYTFVHQVLVECLVEGHTEIPCNGEFQTRVQELSRSGELSRQFSWLNRPRYKRCRPQPDQGKSQSSRHGNDPMFVSVDGFRTKDQFVATQFPQADAVGDFWKTVLVKNISLVVILNDEESIVKIGTMFVPRGEEPLRVSGRTSLMLTKVSDTQHWTLKFVDIKVASRQGKARKESVRVLQFKGWTSPQSLPPSAQNLLLLLQETGRLYLGKGPTLVTCLDGTMACGLFLSLAFVVEKLKLEQFCDVCLAVRSVRLSRDAFIVTEDQFKFLYQAAVHCLEDFETYANFN